MGDSPCIQSQGNHWQPSIQTRVLCVPETGKKTLAVFELSLLAERDWPSTLQHRITVCRAFKGTILMCTTLKTGPHRIASRRLRARSLFTNCVTGTIYLVAHSQRSATPIGHMYIQSTLWDITDNSYCAVLVIQLLRLSCYHSVLIVVNLSVKRFSSTD